MNIEYVKQCLPITEWFPAVYDFRFAYNETRRVFNDPNAQIALLLLIQNGYVDLT